MNRRILAVVSLVFAVGGCSGSSVTVNGPVEVNGVAPIPTETRGQPTPGYRIETPVPAPTPRPS